jgi:hypothetical protein
MMRVGRSGNASDCAGGGACGCRSRAASRARWVVALVLLALAAAAPLVARPDDVVAEAVFLADTLPPGGRDLNLALALAPVEDPETGATHVAAVPRLQLAYALGPRLGFTVESGLSLDGARAPAVATPTASLKLLLREPGADRTGIAGSVDLIGAPDAWAASEVGVGLGAARALGRFTLRAAVWGMSAAGRFAPHAHAGVSVALQAGARVRLLAEAVGDVHRAGPIGVGPTVKVALSDTTSLTAAVLLDVVGRPGFASAVVQLGRAL